MNASLKKRNCHGRVSCYLSTQLLADAEPIVIWNRCFPVKLMIIDDAVGIQGNGNQGTASRPDRRARPI